MSDYLLDRIQLKSKLSFWRNIAILAIACVVIYFTIASRNDNSANTTLQNPYIARITINGEINEDFEREQILSKLANNDKVQAVILRIDSPGGTAFGGESLYHSLRKIAEKKPLIAVIGTMATSGGYMASLAADHVVARSSSLTGSIGAMMLTGEISDLAKKIGLNFILFQSGDLKAEPMFTHPLTDKAKKSTTTLINSTADMFASMVMERRKLTKEQVGRFTDGRVLTGQQAFEGKLIDDIGGEDEAVAWLESNKQIVKTTPIKDVDLKDDDQIFKKFTSPFDKMNETFSSITNLVKSLQSHMVVK